MKLRMAAVFFCRCKKLIVLIVVPLICIGRAWAATGSGQASNFSDGGPGCEVSGTGSPYIPVDSWVYPAVLRLYSLGFLDHIYVGMRPWTAASLSHMLDQTETKIENAREGPVTDEARKLYDATNRELQRWMLGACSTHVGAVQLESSYTVMRGLGGTPLRDSFHLGSTIVNDYGRPYESGFSNYSGVSGFATVGPFALYVRGEFQGATSAAGYPASLAQTLSTNVDLIPFLNPATSLPYRQATIPLGPIGTVTQGRFLEAYASVQVLNHVISFGKEDEWLGPAKGASFAYSDNAENIYAFHINRIEPLYVPLLSRITGPFRYEFLIGPLQGHTYVPNPAYQANPSPSIPNVINPGDPWVHLEKISLRPTENLELGFERTAIWGGKGHGPITLHSFLKSFFSTTAPGGPGATGPNEKYGRNDPGARFASFDFSYRLPYLRNWLTLYTDGEVHDDVSPIDAPRRAAWRPGLYLSHVPGAPRLDARVEAVWTDPPISTSNGGRFMYWEAIQKQGYTNQGQIFGDWIGREDKGGQAWLTYHLSGNEWLQASWRNQKAAKDFIPGGTTLNNFSLEAAKRIGKDFEVDGDFTVEHWKAPVYLPGEQTVPSIKIRLAWWPERKSDF